MRAHPVYGTNGDGGDETDGNVYALPTRPLACGEYKKLLFGGGCVSERASERLVVFCRYREIYATCGIYAHA